MVIQESFELNDQAKDELVALAMQLGAIPDLGIRTIIDALIAKSFSELNLFDNEFLELFKTAEIADSLADKFIHPPSRISGWQSVKDPENLAEARAELNEYLNNYHKGILPTLFQKCQELDEKYGVKIDKLFSPDLRNRLVQKINEAAAYMAENRFGEILKTNPDFYEKFLFPRIVNINGWQLTLNKERLKRAIYFLAKHGQLNENTLFARFHAWINAQPVAGPILKVRDEISEQEPAAISNEGYNNGNFDRLFRIRIAPLISEQRDMELEHKKRIGLDDVIKINFGAMTQVIPSRKSVEPIESIFDGEEGSNATIEHFFNLEPDETIESLKPDLEMAKAQIKWTFDELLKGNIDPDDPVTNEYKFIDEIMACSDIKTLVTWITRPLDLLENLDNDRKAALITEYGRSNIGAVISHEARKILEFMMLYRKCAFYPQVKSGKKDRDSLSNFFVRRLEMTEQEHVTLSFQAKEETASKSRKRFQLIRGETGQMHEPKMDGTIKTHDIESSKFIKTTITIPGPNGTVEKIPVYIYAGHEDRLMHDKDIHSIVSNFLREEAEHPNFTDLVRWTIIPVNPNDYEKVAKYFEVNHMTDGKKRHTINEDGNGISSRSLFAPHDREIISGFADIKADEEDESKTRINFETQIVRNIDDFLLYSCSKHTDSARSKFSAKREAPTIDQILRPPAIHGVRALKAREKIPALKDRAL